MDDDWWTPVIPVPDDIALPDGNNLPDADGRWPGGIAFPYHPLGKPTEVHWFHDREGRVVCGECRFELAPEGPDTKPKKSYRPLTYCRRGDGKVSLWRWQGPPKPYPLFDLPRLIAERSKPVIITEGARKARAAANLFPDIIATAMFFGAEAPESSDSEPLACAEVIIWPDNDAAGLNFARKVTALLVKTGAASVRTVKIPAHFPPKWDLRDQAPDGVTYDYLHGLLDTAEPLALTSDPADACPADIMGGSTQSGEDLLTDLVERSMMDVGVPFEQPVLQQLAELRICNHADFIRLRAALKTTAKVPIGKLDKALAVVGSGALDAGQDDDPSQATMLVQLATKAGAELFHNAVGDSFVTVDIDGHEETWSVRSKATGRWLTKLFYDFTNAAPNSEALKAAANVLGTKAQFDGPEAPVYLRVGERDGLIYLDLCDRDWRAVEIGPDGWRVISNPPIRFRRATGMSPLPEPKPGGTVESLRGYLNVRERTDDTQDDPRFILAVAWLLAALHPRGPYPILGLSGEHGAAKSSFARALRNLVDPNSTPLRSLPREDRDLFIAANNGQVIAFDNVSGLPDWLSDSLCRLATGGGFATRELYTNSDDVLFDAMRPIILNGIEDFIGRPDLADRTIFLTLEEIPDDRRRAEREFWATYDSERPRILGALLNGVARGLKMLPHTKLPRMPRMADFASWVCACEGAFWKPGTFMAAYDDNRATAVETVLDADAVATAVISLISTRTKWVGTATELLAALFDVTTEAVRREKKWLKDGRAVSARLRRATPGLRKIGYIVERDLEGKARTRKITISRAAEKEGDLASASSATLAVALFDGNPKAEARRTLTGEADANVARADAGDCDSNCCNPLVNAAADGTDDPDANSPPTLSRGGWKYDKCSGACAGRDCSRCQARNEWR